jgi:hypothetical protein
MLVLLQVQTQTQFITFRGYCIFALHNIFDYNTYIILIALVNFKCRLSTIMSSKLSTVLTFHLSPKKEGYFSKITKYNS